MALDFDKVKAVLRVDLDPIKRRSEQLFFYAEGFLVRRKMSEWIWSDQEDQILDILSHSTLDSIFSMFLFFKGDNLSLHSIFKNNR